MTGLDVFRDCTREGHATITISRRPGVVQCVSCQGMFRRGPDGTLTPEDITSGQETAPGRPESPSRESTPTTGRKRATQRRRDEAT